MDTTHHDTKKIMKAIDRLKKLFQQVDRAIGRFQKRSKLACLNGCGRCCENPHVETSIAQMLPIAQKLFKDKEVDSVLEALEKKSGEGVCVFYRPNPLIAGKGRCSQYALRPLICRLFGFSARRKKSNGLELMTCVHIKNEYPQIVQDAQVLIDRGYKPPLMQDYSFRAYSLLPQYSESLPINSALKNAIEIVGLNQHIRSKTDLSA